MKSISKIISGIGFIGILFFWLPFFVQGVLNIGNGTFGVLSIMLFVYGIKMKQVNSLIASLWSKLPGKIILCVIAAFALTACIISIVMSALMIKAAYTEPKDNATVIILGCKVYGEKASLSLNARMSAAYEYLKSNPQSACVLSGGQGEGEDISEAECMYRYLTEKGISKDRLFKEDKSTSTRENLEFSKAIIEKEGLNADTAIVTNEFHVYRALQIADFTEINAGAVPAKTAWWIFPTFYTRELFGILYEWVF